MSMTLQQNAYAGLISAYATAIVTAKVGLYVNNVSPIPTNTLGDLTEVDSSVQLWYAEVTGTIGQVYINPDGSLSITFRTVQFNADGTSPACTVYGYFVVLPGTPDVLQAARLLEGGPKQMQTALDSIIVQPTLTFPIILAA